MRDKNGTLGDRFTEEEIEQGLHEGYDWELAEEEDNLPSYTDGYGYEIKP